MSTISKFSFVKKTNIFIMHNLNTFIDTLKSKRSTQEIRFLTTLRNVSTRKRLGTFTQYVSILYYVCEVVTKSNSYMMRESFTAEDFVVYACSAYFKAMSLK